MSRKALKEKDRVYIDKLKSLWKNVKKFIRLRYNTYIKNLADKVESNPKRNFYICRTDSSKSCRLSPVIRRHLSDANPVVNPTDKANIFNNYFHSVFNHAGCHTNISVRKRLSHITLPVSDVFAALLHLDPLKSPGPDGILSLYS